MIILNRLIRRGANEKVQLSKDLNKVTLRATQTVWRKSIPGRTKSQCKGFGARGAGVASLREKSKQEATSCRTL